MPTISRMPLAQLLGGGPVHVASQVRIVGGQSLVAAVHDVDRLFDVFEGPEFDESVGRGHVPATGGVNRHVQQHISSDDSTWACAKT